MKNNFFIFTKNDIFIEIERLHICTWEFNNNTALIEFGGEIKTSSNITDEVLTLNIYVPWIDNNHKVNDLYDKLRDSENSRFIFNDSVIGSDFLDQGQNELGVIQKFTDRSPLCILPIKTEIQNNTIKLLLNLKHFKKKSNNSDTNIYFRFFLEPEITLLSTRKSGINKTTIIYDVKINEKRNLPNNKDIDISEINLCKIKNCFYFNILPNSFELSFFDTNYLKSIRNLEFDSFKKYLGDSRVKKDELVVVFNKCSNSDSYAFFSSYSKERIGTGQFALAVLVNIICGILLFLPSFRSSNNLKHFSIQLLFNLPLEIYISLFIIIMIMVYFFWPKIVAFPNFLKNLFSRKIK